MELDRGTGQSDGPVLRDVRPRDRVVHCGNGVATIVFSAEALQRRAHTLLEERNAISTFLAGCLARVSLDTFMQEICRQIGVEYRKGTAHVRRRLHDRGLIDGTSFNRIERVLDYGNKFVHNKTTKDHDAAQLVAEVDDIIAGLGVKVSAQMLIAPKSEEDLRRCEHHIDYMKQMIRERRRRMWRAKNKV